MIEFLKGRGRMIVMKNVITIVDDCLKHDYKYYKMDKILILAILLKSWFRKKTKNLVINQKFRNFVIIGCASRKKTVCKK